MNEELVIIIETVMPIEGPSMDPGPKDATADSGAQPLHPPAPLRNSPKWYACQSFEATVIQFFSLDGREKWHSKQVRFMNCCMEKDLEEYSGRMRLAHLLNSLGTTCLQTMCVS